MDPVTSVGLASSILSTVALARDAVQFARKTYNQNKMRNEFRKEVRILLSLRERHLKALGIDEWSSTIGHLPQYLRNTSTHLSGLRDRATNDRHELETLKCLFPCCEACFMDDEALSLHVESHLDMLPYATSGSFEITRKELCSLQNALHIMGEVMRWYENIECSQGESPKDWLRHLGVALDELKEYAERHGSSRRYRPHYMEYNGGTQMERWRPLLYESVRGFQRGIAKAIERATLKIDISTRCDLEWHTLEKYSPSASYTPSLGKGAQSVAHVESFCPRYEWSYGQDFGVLDVSCLILGKILCPPLQWLSLQSLQPEVPSPLDQSLLRLFPSIHQLVTTLSRHHTLALSMCFASTSLTALALFIPLSHTSESCRSPVLFCCWLALVASGPLWTYIGGSAASLFLVFMPYAMSVGISLGLLWYLCVTKREYRNGMTQDELQRKSSFSKVADTS